MAPDASIDPTDRDWLLAGWRDIPGDLYALTQRIAGIDERCACGASHAQPAAQPCCVATAKRAASECRACAAAVRDIGTRMAQLEEETVRLLPSTYQARARIPERYDTLVDVEQSIAQTLSTFLHLVRASDQLAGETPLAGLSAVKARAEDVAIASRRLRRALRRLQ